MTYLSSKRLVSLAQNISKNCCNTKNLIRGKTELKRIVIHQSMRFNTLENSKTYNEQPKKQFKGQ